MKTSQYISVANEALRALLAEIHAKKAYRRGYPKELSEKLGITENAASQAMRGRSAKTDLVKMIVEDFEKELKIRKTKPQKIDCKNMSLKDLVEKRLLPKNYSSIAAEMTGLSDKTIRVVVYVEKKRSEKAEKALRKLAAYNLENELLHRLQIINRALNEESPAVT
ncbi:MAG TPA: hypothetical protein ENJ95_03515 [Bacteroidetes bacterium]|nr:hypothetical protein [Bacteroidota bacterium]